MLWLSETSAKTGEAVEEMFYAIAHQLLSDVQDREKKKEMAALQEATDKELDVAANGSPLPSLPSMSLTH